MRRGQLLIPAALIIGATFSLPAAGQRESYSFVSYVGPDVALLSTASDEEAARINTPVLSGDRVVTGAGSRAEVVLASGNVVRVDVRTELRFDRMSRTYESDDDRDLLVLLKGAVAAEIRTPETGERAFRLDTDDATIVVEGRGHVRVDVGRRGTDVYVLSGEAEVVGRGGQALVRAGQYALVLGDSGIDVESVDGPRDRFARFVDERSDRRPQGGGATWVASDYEYESSLAGFDDNGSWVYASSSDSWCWRPTVAADWRPYTYGYWRWTPGGLTWVSYEPWGWLPYHYGSWWWENSYGWVWSPGAAYAPAWVYWSYSPSYVGWCPMGYYGHGQDRSRRRHGGHDGGDFRVPYHRGRVQVSQVDPRGWNYTSLPRIGGHLDPSRDILHGERVPFKPTDTAIISTSPLRIERGAGPAPAVVRDALRKVAQPAVFRGAVPVNEGLTAFLRRDPALTPAAERELRRVLVPARRDEALHPATLETLRPPGAAVSRGTGASASRGDDWRAPTSSNREPVLRGGTPPRREPLSDNGWRSPASPAPRDLSPRPTESAGPSDTGWRAPRATETLRAPQTPARRGVEGDWREAPSRAPVLRSGGAGAAPRREVAPRVSGPEAAPQRFERPAPRYEAPARVNAAPRYAPAPAPHVAAPAPAPRVAVPAPAPHAAAPPPARAPHAAAAPRSEAPKQH